MTTPTLLRAALHVVRRTLLGRPVEGREVVTLAQVDTDSRITLTTDEAAALQSFSRCIACGLCDVQFSGYRDAARRELRGPSDLPLSYSRNLTDYGSLTEYLTSLMRGDLQALERVCPSRIEFSRLAPLVQRCAQASAGGEPGADLPRPPRQPG